MSKTMKKFVLAIALFIGLTFTFLGLTSINPIQAKADASTTYFSMDSGVQLRLASSLENETHYGMRFIASMDETTATTADSFGMLIVPAEYVTDITDGVQYASKITEKDGDYIAAYAELGTAVLNVSGITPYASGTGYKMNGVISDIKYDNLNRDFVAIAYSVVGSDYIYTAVSEPANVYDLSIKALADTKTDYDVEELAVLDEYRFLAEKQVAGVEEQTAKDGVLAYTTAVANIRAGLTGDQIVNFDSDDYVEIVSDALKTKVNQEGDGKLTVANYNSSAYKVNLPNPILVKSDSVIVFNLMSPGGNSTAQKGQTYINFDGTSGTEYNLVGWEDVPNFKLITKSLVNDLGRTEGEIITALWFTAWNDGAGYTNYDYIETYSASEREAAIKQQLIDGLSGYEVANYNDANYSSYVSKKAGSYSISDGVLSLTCNGNSNPFTLQFIKPQEVKSGDYITMRVKTAAGNGIEIGDETFTTKYRAIKNGGSYRETNATQFTFFGRDDWQDIIIPVSYLGYEEGETINAITLVEWNWFGHVIEIDHIGYISNNNGALVDFTSKASVGAIQTHPDASAHVTNCYGIEFANIGYDETEKATFVKNTRASGENPCAFVMNIPTITLTADTEISITVKSDATVYLDNDKTFDWRGLTGNTNGEWKTVTFKPTSLGYAAGSTFSQILLLLGSGGTTTCYFGQVTVSNAG